MGETEKNDPKLAAPNPSDVFNDLCENLLEPLNESGGESDQLTVTLALNHAPNHSNGQWRNGKVVWTTGLDPDRPLPVLCYATWSDPNAEFQEKHFGKVILDGDGLTQYCLWQNGLSGRQASEWESFLASLQPEAKIREKLAAFQFTAESALTTTNQLNIGRKLLVHALSNVTNAIPANAK